MNRTDPFVVMMIAAVLVITSFAVAKCQADRCRERGGRPVYSWIGTPAGTCAEP
jgi:hypothetical protein